MKIKNLNTMKKGFFKADTPMGEIKKSSEKTTNVNYLKDLAESHNEILLP